MFHRCAKIHGNHPFVALQDVKTTPPRQWKTWIVGDPTFVAYHINYQIPRWNHLAWWCQFLSNIGKALWWFHTFHPTTMVWWVGSNVYPNLSSRNLFRMLKMVALAAWTTPLLNNPINATWNVPCLGNLWHFHNEL